MPQVPSPGSNVGISESALVGSRPLHGLRHPPEGDTSGWYLWSGELSDAPDFFRPCHVEHVAEVLPEVIPYLSLPPGWRFSIASGHEDAWEDPSLLDVN